MDSSSTKLARATAKLDAALHDNDYYAALQLYRTLVKRKIDAGALADAEAMIVEGARTMLKHGKALEGLDLGDMLLKSLFAAHSQPLTAKALDAIRSIAEAVPSPSASAGATFLKSAVRWGKEAPADPSPVTTRTPTPEGGSAGAVALADGDALTSQQRRHVTLVSELHLAAAKACVSAGPEFYADAQRYFLESHAPAPFADFLVAWTATGYARERDLFLARAVLQLLCLGYLGDANGVFERFGAQIKLAEGGGASVMDTPLSHFLKFLLATLERDAKPLFDVLCDKYKAALSRDASFGSYMAAIALRFFKVQPAQAGGMAAMMQNMMAMLGGGGGGGGGAGGGVQRPGGNARLPAPAAQPGKQ